MYRLRRGETFGEKQVAGSAALKTRNSINANNYNAAPAAIAAYLVLRNRPVAHPIADERRAPDEAMNLPDFRIADPERP